MMTQSHQASADHPRGLDDLLAFLSAHGGRFTNFELDTLRERIDELVNYAAAVGVMGKSGAGKSALCNALFGQEATEVSAVDPCTRHPKEIDLACRYNKGISLIDVPGVGESIARDKEYASLYASLLPELDLILWVIKADDRALHTDEQVYQHIIKPYTDQHGIPVLFVINQLDKIEPSREWDWERQRPSGQQLYHLQLKTLRIVQRFAISPLQVCAVSASTGYGLATLIEAVIKALPAEKRWGIARETQSACLSPLALEEAEAGLWASICSVIRDLLQERAAWLLDKVRTLLNRLRSWID
ncbi:GTPase family protein [Chitinibacter sp. S2-10]|uniref:GTPase family protein n=1 Tax=Chitinibacter sp. S2-10 TaxID=3373597 RepID=UPI003977256C